MPIGVPKEIRCDEFRAGLLPVGVQELCRAGHRVVVESGAGLGSGLSDQIYAEQSAEMVASPEEVYTWADVLHYCLANLHGAVGRTSSFALCNATLPWATRIAGHGLATTAERWTPVESAINACQGELTNKEVAEAPDLQYSAGLAA